MYRFIEIDINKLQRKCNTLLKGFTLLLKHLFVDLLSPFIRPIHRPLGPREATN